MEVTIEESTLYRHHAQSALGVITELLLSPPEGIEFAEHFPIPEYENLTELLLESGSCGVPFPVTVPVCPDYPESGYELGSGVGLTTRRFLHRLPSLMKMLDDNDLQLSVEIDIADVEILDPILRKRLAMSSNEFTRRMQSTREETRKEILRRGFAHAVTVGFMSDRFAAHGVDYSLRQRELADLLLKHSGKKARRALKLLMEERLRSEDYQDLGLSSETEFLEAAAYEIAGYAAYGELIGPDALICSPDAASAVPGYNVLKKDNGAISPTAYIKPPRRIHGNIFSE